MRYVDFNQTNSANYQLTEPRGYDKFKVTSRANYFTNLKSNEQRRFFRI